MKQVILFVEGVDRCGKTQIAKELAKCISVPYFKASSEHDSYLSDKVNKRDAFLNQLRYADPRVFDVLKQTGYGLIFDRGFPSEFAYSKVMGRRTDMAMLEHMDNMWASIGARIILCRRTSYVGIVDDIDPEIDEVKLAALDAAYQEFACWTSCEVYQLNVDDENLDREVTEVVSFLQKSYD
jgi:thymidylate kinase